MPAGLPGCGAIVLAVGSGALSQRLLRRGASGRLGQGVPGGLLAILGGGCLLAVSRLDASPLLLVAVAFSAGTAQTPLNNAALADLCPPARRAAVLGAGYALSSIATLASPLVTGLLIDTAPDRATGFGRAFDPAAGLLVAGGVAAVCTVRPERDAARLGSPARAPSPALSAPSASSAPRRPL